MLGILFKRPSLGFGILLTSAYSITSGQQPVYGGGTVYEDTRIRTIAYPLGAGQLNQPFSRVQMMVTGSAPFSTDGFVGLATTIHPDNRNEAFNAHRLTGWDMNTPGPYQKKGVWVDYFRFASGYPYMAAVDNLGKENFFNTPVPHKPSRTFSSFDNNRGYTKVDYICPGTCGSSDVSAYYFKLGGWDMYTKAALTFPLPSPLVAADIVNLDAAIHSDGGSNGYIVDKLSHIAQNVYGGSGFGVTPSQLGRGGNIWYGNGCNAAPCRDPEPSPRIRVFGGPFTNDIERQRSSYRGARYKWLDSDLEGNRIPYSDKSVNRGWVKLEFINKSLPQPHYAIKSKAVAIGGWNMADEPKRIIQLSRFGISANRIVDINTTIQSDFTTSSVSQNGWQMTSLNMHLDETPSAVLGVGQSGGGGITLVRNGEIHLSMSKRLRGDVWYNYYSARHSQGAPYNRGWVKVDYLAGSCEQGPAGFSIRAIPGSNSGNCSGTNQPFIIEGAGQGFSFGSWALADSFTFVSRQITQYSATITVRIENRDSKTVNAALSGLTFRNSLAVNSQHASLLTSKTTSGGLQWWTRTCFNCTNLAPITQTGTTNPMWLRLKKVGNDFTAQYHLSTSTTMPPSGWTQLGSTKNIPFSSMYFAGLVVSNSTSGDLARTTFRNVVVSNP